MRENVVKTIKMNNFDLVKRIILRTKSFKVFVLIGLVVSCVLIQSDYFNNDQAEAKYATIPSDLLLKDIQTSSGESFYTGISL